MVISGISRYQYKHCNTYKNNYLSNRDKLKSALANAYAIDGDNASFNGCIGDSPAGDPDLGLDWYGFPNLSNNINLVCGDNSGAYYNKIKRIISEDLLYNSNDSTAQTGQNLNINTLSSLGNVQWGEILNFL